MKVTVCIGSSCHLKGSKSIVEKFQELIAANQLKRRLNWLPLSAPEIAKRESVSL